MTRLADRFINIDRYLQIMVTPLPVTRTRSDISRPCIRLRRALDRFVCGRYLIALTLPGPTPIDISLVGCVVPYLGDVVLWQCEVVGHHELHSVETLLTGRWCLAVNFKPTAAWSGYLLGCMSKATSITLRSASGTCTILSSYSNRLRPRG
ncbi:hypothetical protein DAEQUDRAFT_721988 [Daedalea quercina L-15889]|uniref:Uncharacterized protein n=1 Tax=Daedalea quercina L-15889 TaxID=1314783 RepID=A0A165TG69_9APHY|nr:hypothetical protein DAEQUDRAFT_721988 [Daedalea quercina L-15889]